MKTMKKAIALGLAVSLAFLNVPMNVRLARADDSDIFGANIAPNVLFLIDTSNSMTDEVPASSYDPKTNYTVGGYVYSPNQGYVYKYNTSNKTYSQFKTSISSVPDADGSDKSAARDALTSSGFWYGKIGGTQYYLFTGNYMNWKSPSSASTKPKIDMAKQVLSDIIMNTDGVRFGVMKIKPSCPLCGGEIVAPVGSTKSDLLTAVSGLTAPGGSGTPTGEQIRDAGTYYGGKFGGYPSPI